MSKLRKEYEAVFGVVEGCFSLYDAKGNEIYIAFSDGERCKYQYDAEGNMIYIESSDGYGCKYEYDAKGCMIYSEHSVDGVQLDIRPCADKVFIEEKTGKKFKMTEIK
jgi:YD repeat-containing protein|tara:strand:- start:561 stop:884 length:324 start_codon:yes stop_codon:yes gene_type:complete